jgi:hypothetical protein
VTMRKRLFGILLAIGLVLPGLVAKAQSPAVRTIDVEAGTVVGSSPDGTRIAVVSPGISLCVLESATLEHLSCASLAGRQIAARLDDMVWSPDSTRIAFSEPGFDLGTDSDVWVMNATTGELTNLTDDGYAGSVFPTNDDDPAATATFFVDASPAWTPDGAYLSFSRTGFVNGDSIGNVLARIPASGGEVEELVRISDKEPGVAFYRSGWSPDGTILYFTFTGSLILDADNGVWAYDTTTGTTAPLATFHDQPNLGPPALLEVSRTGNSLLVWYPTAVRDFTLSETLIRLIDLETNTVASPNLPLLGPRAIRGMTQGTFSPDGSAILLLVDTADDNSNDLWKLDLATNELTLVLEGVPDPLYNGWIAVSWGANGTVVIGLQDGGAIVSEIV